MTDAEVINVVIDYANQGMEMARLAQTRTLLPDVRDYTGRVRGDLDVIKSTMRDAARELEIDLKEERKEPRKKAQSIMRELTWLQRLRFEEAYLEKNIELHSEMINRIANELQPEAQSSYLKLILSNLRPQFEQHLDNARILLDLREGIEEEVND